MKKFTFKSTKEQTEKIKTKIKESGGVFQENKNFRFNGIIGKVEFLNNELLVTITDKPSYISWKKLEKKMSDYTKL